MNEGIAPGAPSPSARAAFTGEFRHFVTRGALLELVIFGFYRFWLATNIRWHLWSNSSVAGDALEYTGTGRELLIGFLFACLDLCSTRPAARRQACSLLVSGGR